MMKNPFSRFMGLATAGVVVCGAIASAWALQVTVDQLVPGVNSAGQPDNALGATIPITANVNTRRGTFVANGSGRVTNQTGNKQTYENLPISVPGVTVNSSLYTVKANGKCNVHAAGVVIPPAESSRLASL